MNNYLLVLLSGYKNEYLINKVKSLNIKKIIYSDKGILIKITDNNFEIIKKYYSFLNPTIVKYYGIKGIIKWLSRNYFLIIINLMSLFLIIFLSNIIFSIEIKHENNYIIDLITKEINNQGINEYSIKKSYDELDKIKKSIINKYSNDIEWLEIEEKGIKYIVSVEERVIKDLSLTNSYCHVVAHKNAIIRRVNAIKGQINNQENDYVREGDIIISGDIKLNNQIKNQVCAKGEVFGEVWYVVNVNIPKSLIVKEYSNKKRYNISIETIKYYHKIFRPQYHYYDTSKIKLIDFLGLIINFEKEYEYLYKTELIDDNELMKYAEEKAIKALNIKLNSKEYIIDKNVLKKTTNDSTINIELFVSVNELIGKQIIGSNEGIDYGDTE